MSSSASSLPALFLSFLLALPMAATATTATPQKSGSSPQSSPVKNSMHPAARHAHAGPPIQGDARIQHLLNRLTFGPRSADFAAVKRLGTQEWIEQQLHPQQIDDSALDARLAMYPALHMDVKDLLQQLPPRPVIRQIINGKFSIPKKDPLRAVYQTQVAMLELRREKKAEKQAATNPQPSDTASPASPAHISVTSTAAGDSDLKVKKQQIFADLEDLSIVNLPPAQRMQKVLSMQTDARISFYRNLSQQDRIAFVRGLTPQQAQLFSGMANPTRTVASQLEAAKILRVIDSNRQLQEVMTDFWFNHFNVDIRKNALMTYYLGEYENQVLRPNALGNFEDLLVATARSRAMLLYLDNAASVGPHSLAALQVARGNSGMNAQQQKRPAPGLNENYGRELMELHTLGVNGGYTQQDVIEVAKAFTGWTIDKPLQGGGFVFNARRHEPGTKYVLGHQVSESGEEEGLQVLHILATSPATAHHISEELAERFVSDHPPQPLVNRMAETFLSTHGDIRAVLRTMFSSPEFWSHESLNAKVKTPLEFVASSVRAGGTQVQSPLVLAFVIARLGMPLYDCQPPTGYSMNADAWVSSGSLVERMDFAVAFANNRLPGVVNHWDALANDEASSFTENSAFRAAHSEARLEQLLLHGNVSAHTHQVVINDLADPATQAAPESQSFAVGKSAAQGYIVPAAASSQPSSGAAPSAPQMDRQTANAAALLIGSPDFQSR